MSVQPHGGLQSVMSVIRWGTLGAIAYGDGVADLRWFSGTSIQVRLTDQFDLFQPPAPDPAPPLGNTILCTHSATFGCFVNPAPLPEDLTWGPGGILQLDAIDGGGDPFGDPFSIQTYLHIYKRTLQAVTTLIAPPGP